MQVCDLKLGYMCNNECVHCVIADNRRALEKSGVACDLTTDECIRILDENKSLGVDHIIITGGEVTIRPDFLELAQYCNDLGFSIGIQTNGRKLSNMALCLSLAKISGISFVIAIHGPNKNIHDKITKRPGSFDETLTGMQNILRLGMNLTAKIVILKCNQMYLIDILKLLYSLGVVNVHFAFPHGLGNARKNFDALIPRYNELKHILERIIDESQNMGIQLGFEAIPYCIIPKYPEYVGEIYDALNIKRLLKPVEDSTLDWNEERRSIKRKGLHCSECCLNMICEGIWMEYLEHFGDEELVPISFSSDIITKLFTKLIIISK